MQRPDAQAGARATGVGWCGRKILNPNIELLNSFLYRINYTFRRQISIFVAKTFFAFIYYDLLTNFGIKKIADFYLTNLAIFEEKNQFLGKFCDFCLKMKS